MLHCYPGTAALCCALSPLSCVPLHCYPVSDGSEQPYPSKERRKETQGAVQSSRGAPDREEEEGTLFSLTEEETHTGSLPESLGSVKRRRRMLNLASQEDLCNVPGGRTNLPGDHRTLPETPRLFPIFHPFPRQGAWRQS